VLARLSLLSKVLDVMLRASNILFVELLGGIGDLLIALPAIQALAHSHPGSELTVLTFAPGGELLHGHPLIHRVVVVVSSPDAEHPHRARQSVAKVMTRHTFDLIVSDTNYDGIDQAIQHSGASRVITNL
jgi:ADP-heptose:LPS heptosyltransferase